MTRLKLFFKEVLAPVTAMMLFVFFMLAFIQSAACHSRAERMGLTCSYGPLQGCMVEVSPGKWIPLESYRVGDK